MNDPNHTSKSTQKWFTDRRIKVFAMAITVPRLKPHRKSVGRAEAEYTSVDLRIWRIWRDTVCRNSLRSRAMCSPTSSRIIEEDSELLSWQRETAQNIKLRGANNCGTPVLENNIYLMSTFFFSFNHFTSMKRFLWIFWVKDQEDKLKRHISS